MKKQGLKKRMAMMLILFIGWHMTARPGVIITGMLDGTLSGGCPKVIELFVTGTENLNYYEIWRSLNGAPFGSGSGAISSMSGVFTNTFVYLVKTDHVDAFVDVFGNEGIFANVVPMGIINGNGNDGFQVRLKVGSVVIDQVWLEDATDSYVDSYWYRKHGTGPDGGWYPSAWETPGNDALDDLDMAGLQAAVPFGTYAVTWQGLTADWNDIGNWSLSFVPSFQTNILIGNNAAHFPVITNLPENPAVCMDMTIADTASIIILAGKALTVYGDLNLESPDTVNFSRGLILKSDSSASPTGSLIIFGNASGEAIIERYLARDNSWHFISSPVAGQNFQPGFVPDPVDNSYDLYCWDENAEMSAGWLNSRDESGSWNPLFGDSFIIGKGYLAAYSPSYSGPGIRTFSGLPVSGNNNIPLSHSGNYWNLLGNPYTSALDWSSSGIDKSLIAGNAMYIWDNTLNDNQGGYRVHNGTTGVPDGTTPIIPALQGFFIQSLDTGLLAVDVTQNDPLIHNYQSFYKSANELSENSLRLNIEKDQFSDEMLICFNEAASNEYDSRYDAEKLFNGHLECPEIYSFCDSGKPLCINTVPQSPVSVPIGIICAEEDMLVLRAFDFSGMDPETGIFLEDKLLNYWIDLREQSEYQFYHDQSQPEGRIILHFSNIAGEQEPYQSYLPDLWQSGDNIYISNPGNACGKLDLYSIEGKWLQSYDFTGGKNVIRLEVPAGLYVARMNTPSATAGRKIIIYK